MTARQRTDSPETEQPAAQQTPRLTLWFKGPVPRLVRLEFLHEACFHKQGKSGPGTEPGRRGTALGETKLRGWGEGVIALLAFLARLKAWWADPDQRGAGPGHFEWKGPKDSAPYSLYWTLGKKNTLPWVRDWFGCTANSTLQRPLSLARYLFDRHHLGDRLYWVSLAQPKPRSGYAPLHPDGINIHRDGACLAADDVSGFTRLAEALEAQGPEKWGKAGKEAVLLPAPPVGESRNGRPVAPATPTGPEALASLGFFSGMTVEQLQGLPPARLRLLMSVMTRGFHDQLVHLALALDPGLDEETARDYVHEVFCTALVLRQPMRPAQGLGFLRDLLNHVINADGQGRST